MADTPIEVPTGSLVLTGNDLVALFQVPPGSLPLTGFAPVTIPEATVVVNEILSLPEIVSPSIVYTVRILTDTFQTDDQPKVIWAMVINEALNYSETQLVDWIITTVEELFATDTVVVNGTYQGLLAEIMGLEDFPTAWKQFNDIISESYNLSDALIDFHRKVTVIVDILNITETVINTGTFQAFLADVLNLEDSLERIFKELLDEAFNLSEVITDNGIFLTPISEAFNVSDVVAELFTATTSVVESFQTSDNAVVQGTYFVLSNDQVIFQTEVVISGNTFACWVLTTKNYNPSVYSNFDFNSYDRLGDKLYGAREDGIYLLEGVDDAGDDVHTGLLFDFANMDIPATKRMRTVHLGSKTTQASVQVATDRGIGRTYRTKHQRAVVGKEVRGKFWTIAIEDVDDLKSMELNVVLISKTR